MTPEQRLHYAETHLRFAAETGFLQETSCTRIAETYGCMGKLPELKRLKGQLFPEFLSNGEGK